MQGKVKFYNKEKGFGFIENGEGPDIYFNQQSLSNAIRFLKGGAEISFDVFPTGDGKLKAKNIRLASHSHSQHTEMPNLVMT